MTTAARPAPEAGPLEGIALVVAAFVLALSNTMAVLDITIANVSIPNISGGLAVSTDQGTWVITSYGIAEAIAVPLTGWLARRFGQIRTFCVALAMFGLCSALCGLAHSFMVLVFLRVLQGFAGGPMIPLSQTLLRTIFPKEQATTAGTIWTMGTVIGPVLGPLLGGVLCDQFSWQWIFLINVPFAISCSGAAWVMLRHREGPTVPQRLDGVGLGLLIVWIGALQVMLDRGKDLDWFGSPLIVSCAIVAAVGFIAFVIWELTDRDPIVDLSVFKYRGYTMLVITLCFGYGCFFASVVLSPLWMQTSLGYTPTRAALAVAPAGLLFFFLAPFIQKLMARIDNRAIICGGVTALASTMVWRSTFASDVPFHDILLTHLAMGCAISFILLPIYATFLNGIPLQQVPGAAGLMNFLRTTSNAFAASIVTVVWDNSATRARTGILQGFDGARAVSDSVAAGLAPDQALYAADGVVQSESVMLATNHVYFGLALILSVAAFLVWFTPRAKRAAAPGSVH